MKRGEKRVDPDLGLVEFFGEIRGGGPFDGEVVVRQLVPPRGKFWRMRPAEWKSLPIPEAVTDG